jgi:tetratricopeptide (TPR) repeat protein
MPKKQREIARSRKGSFGKWRSASRANKALDLDGMKQAVRNAIDIYEKEISGRPVETNLDDIVNRALARAKEQVDRGQSSLARATLRRAAAEMQREEVERRERYEAGVTTLYTHERDIALATHDGEAAADAVALLADAIHGAKAPSAIQLLNSEAQTLYGYGYFRGSTVHLIASIALWRKVLSVVSRTDSPFEWAAARTDLGFALLRLGERESGTARLEEAVAVLRKARQETSRSSASLQSAKTQNKLAFALLRLGERESGTARLVEAVAMFREAAQAPALANAPSLRVMIRKNLGLALTELGERESGTARLEEAVAVLGDAAHGTSRSSASLQWALIQNNIGGALLRLGEREAGTARLEEAVGVYQAAFPEETRVQAPVQWAQNQRC